VSLQSASSETGTIVTGSSPPTTGPYVGRFAPSPTGPLHFGSLIAAVASFLEARVRDGRWLLRMEDIDPPRAQSGATQIILQAMESYGFEWDGPVIFQSDSRSSHDEALAMLLAGGLAYRCGCSRRDLGPVYPGTCREGSQAAETALRVLTNNEEISFVDELQGRQTQRLESEFGDFVVLRKDGLIAYQLAVVVDDHLQGITDIVRGIDLMDSTPRQIWLQQLLGYRVPNYLHIPVAINTLEQKLSKSHGSGGIPLTNVAGTLHTALATLGQRPPPELENAAVAEIWSWAIENWNIAVLNGQTQIPVAENLYRLPNTKSNKNP
jgi:glutamyl-Q tRNA(Asp) synthetase